MAGVPARAVTPVHVARRERQACYRGGASAPNARDATASESAKSSCRVAGYFLVAKAPGPDNTRHLYERGDVPERAPSEGFL